MLAPFFRAAMRAPGRQLAFRKAAVGHTLAVAALAYAVSRNPTTNVVTSAGYLLLALGIVEGAALVGWRLTQLPKSQALEFLLTSPVQPRRLFLAELAVGVGRFALVWLAGLPLLVGLVFAGAVAPADLWLLAAMPFQWGLFAGVALTAWIYEPKAVRRVGEALSLLGVLTYLIVGVVAAENLMMWLHALPEWLGRAIFGAVRFAHHYNPFGVVQRWFDPNTTKALVAAQLAWVSAAGAALTLLAAARASARLVGHFHDRHYAPIDSSRADQSGLIADRPLSWWAVRRVMEYSGRVNLYLAGGFAAVYAAYIVAGDAWPAWMGRLVFQLFENWGGAPALASGLAVMATIPAVFQYGLWDSSAQDRVRRLELLLLSDLDAPDYWHASITASWKRGRGYLIAAALLWLALGVSGRVPWAGVCGAMAGAAVLWSFSFAVGFKLFASGSQTSALASLMVLGVPGLLVAAFQFGVPTLGALTPPGLTFLPLKTGPSAIWCGSMAAFGGSTIVLSRRALATCVGNLREWTSANHGLKAA